jgi:3-isopropylmalate/(R)-2-methylmalate dehydratase small subunit
MFEEARAWFLGDDIDTDQIMPTRYLAFRTAEDLAPYALSGNDPAWATTISPGDVIVAGKNFGCGSSREHAPLGLKGLGVRCVIAQSFSRIFYRNAVNIGLALLVVPDAIEPQPAQGSSVWVNFADGLVSLDGGVSTFVGIPPAPIVLDILAHGGLMPMVASRT